MGSLALAAGPAQGKAPPGAVYVQTNTAPANQVQVYNRAANGAISPGAMYATGGAGNPANNPPLGIPFLDSARSVDLSDNGRLLFVVNAGDNTVSSFRVKGHGLRRADKEPTQGTRPISAASFHSRLLYVLNSDKGSASITGFRVASTGKLTPISGSTRSTTTPASDLPAQIRFSAGGSVLVVSDRGSSTLDTFRLNRRGAAQAPVSHPSSGQGPFGIDFTHRGLMIVSDEHFPETDMSTVSTYGVTRSGGVSPIDHQSAQSGGACWTVITPDDKFVYVTSPFTGSIVAFRIGGDGKLTPVTANAHVADTMGLTLDEDLSHNGRFLYVLKGDSPMFMHDTILSYRLNPDGTLTALGETATFVGSSAGLAAW